MATQQGPTLTDADGGSSIGFKAAIAFYGGVIVAGVVTLASVVAGADNATVLSTFPTVVTAVTILGIVLVDRTSGLAIRLGRSRRRRLVWFLPAAALGSIWLAHLVGLVTLEWRLAFTTGLLFVLTTPLALGGARMARNRVAAAKTPDEPIVQWVWHRSGLSAYRSVSSVLLGVGLLISVASVLATGSLYGLFFTAYCVAMLYSVWTDRNTNFDPTNRWNPPTISVHETGLRIEKPLSKTFVSWDAIESVRLTDDELVVERPGWLDVRCDRGAIDDPDAVLEAIERARTGDDPGERGRSGDDPSQRGQTDGDSSQCGRTDGDTERETLTER